MNAERAGGASRTWRMALGAATFLGAMLFAAIPFLVHILPWIYGYVLYYSLPTFLLGFVLCGVAGGAVFGFIAIGASIAAHFVVLEFVRRIQFAANEDLFYFIALLGTISYCLSAAVTVLVLQVRKRRAERT